MRVILRDSQTGLFVAETGAWTQKIHDARSFKHSAEAMDHAREFQLTSVEVLLSFEQPPHLVVLPIR